MILLNCAFNKKIGKVPMYETFGNMDPSSFFHGVGGGIRAVGELRGRFISPVWGRDDQGHVAGDVFSVVVASPIGTTWGVAC